MQRIIVSTTILFCLALGACSKSSDSGNTQSFTSIEGDVISDFVNKTALPQYDNLVTTGKALNTAITTLNSNTTDANLQTAQTNFVAAVAQCEAAMEIFRPQGRGHLVVISSMSAMRGLPGNLTVYAATKAGVAALGEGLQAECLKKRLPIRVSTIFPGYIRSEINEKVKNTPFMVDTQTGCRALGAAIEKEPARACVPAWPWRLIGWYMRNAPLSWVGKMS